MRILLSCNIVSIEPIIEYKFIIKFNFVIIRNVWNVIFFIKWKCEWKKNILEIEW